MMSKFHILITITSVIQNVKLDVIDIWRQTCPHNDLCSVGKLSNFKAAGDYVPCCSKCFCDEDCKKFDDCCPDIEGEVTMLSGMECTTTAVNNPVIQNLKSEDRDRLFLSLRMISSCPEHFTGNRTITDMCAEIFENYPSSDDMVIVSDRYHHDDIYKNKHCAACNGVQETIRWNFHVAFCSNAWDGNTKFSELKELVWKNCTVYSTPPAHLQFSRPLFDCGYRLISNCSDTNSTFRTSCERGPYAPLYVPSLVVTQIYKNPLCYLCQVEQMASPNTCHRGFLDTRKTVMGGRMSMLLEMDEKNMDARKGHETIEKMQCDEKEIYDRIQDRCRTLSCPWNSVVFYGSCLKFSDSIWNVDVPLKLVFRPVLLNQPHGKVLDYDSNLQGEIVSNLQKRFGLKKCTINKVSVILCTEKANNMTSFLTIDFLIRVSQECSFDFISSNTRKLAAQPHRILLRTINGAIQMRGTVSFFQSSNVFDPSLYQKYALIYYNYRLSIPFLMTNLYICPYLKLNLSEYNSLITKYGQKSSTLSYIIATSIVHNEFYVLSNDTIAVCVDTYFELSVGKGVNSAEGTHSKSNFILNHYRLLSTAYNLFLFYQRR